MKSFTTIVLALTCLVLSGELGAKYILVEIDGGNDGGGNNVDTTTMEPMAKGGKIFSKVKIWYHSN